MQKDYIDSCVFLGVVLDHNTDCKDYVNTIGYKSRNLGVISHFVLSEIFMALLTKIHNKDKIEEEYLLDETFRNITTIFKDLLKNNRLIINKLNKSIVDIDLFNELKNMDFNLSDDDIFHLIEAIKSNCKFFVTLDKEIIKNSKLRENLSGKYNLKIIELV